VLAGNSSYYSGYTIEQMQILLSLLGFVCGAVGLDVVGSMGCTMPVCVFSNKYLRFGSGTETSVNSYGLFVQPWYYSELAAAWYKLTFSNYPLDTAIGFGNSSSHWTGATIFDVYTLTPTTSSTDYSNYIVNASDASKTVGFGKIIATRSFLIDGRSLIFENTFSLGQNDRFVRITNVVINNSTAPISNTYIWVGTRDDFVGMTDVNTKTRGNIIGGNFTAITANNQSSRAIMITNTDEGVIFYAETPGVMTAYSSCCSFANAYNANPLMLAPSTPVPTDGSYAAVLPLGTVAVNSAASITWFYAAGVISSLAEVAQTVAIAQVAVAAPVSTFSSFPTFTAVPTFINTYTSISTPTGTATPTATESAKPTGTPTPTATATGTPTTTITVTPTSAPLRVVVIPAWQQPNITINEFLTTIINGGVEQTNVAITLVYILLAVNLVLVFSCLGALVCLVYRRYAKKEAVEAVEPVEPVEQEEVYDTDVVNIRAVEEGGKPETLMERKKRVLIN